MKLKNAIRGRLVISCCYFRQTEHGPSPNPDSVLYGPRPIAFLGGAVNQEIHWPIACELSHSTRCYTASQIVHSRTRTLWLWIQTDRETCEPVTTKNNNSAWRSQRLDEFSPRVAWIFGQYKKPVTDGGIVQECMSEVAEILLEGKQTQKCYFFLN